jgi:precorrin-2 dehydrogenase/sirohydrochlorin ferrochelatase
MLRLEGQRCVVVGGGAVATRKIEGLLQAGAVVTVIAPRLTAGLARLVTQGLVVCEKRTYRRGDLVGAALAFAATSSRQVNASVAEEARQLKVPVNVADDPAACTFQVPAVVRQDGLTLAVSTAGRSPAYARRLRQELEHFLAPERLALLELYAEARQLLQQPVPAGLEGGS